MAATSGTQIKGKNEADLAERLRNFLAGYRAEFQRDVSSTDGHIYWSKPLRKWMLVRKKGMTVDVTFHNDCPCSEL
jgi:hypothetical protein